MPDPLLADSLKEIEALALLKNTALKRKKRYVIITFGYNNKLILPHDEGIAIMDALANAEVIKFSGSNNIEINPVDADTDYPSITFMSEAQYLEAKMKQLLGANDDE